MTGTFVGNIDLAQVTLYAFWIFFFGLVVYIQRENQREGYPLEDDDGVSRGTGGLFPNPSPKTFLLPHGRGSVSFPNDWREDREFKMRRVYNHPGSAYEPTGEDPMTDGVGPAAYAMRKDVPELDGHGKPKIRPMAVVEDYYHCAGRDPRGMRVIAGDGAVVGQISDMWVDVPEQLVRYLEVTLEGEGGKRLIPMPMAKITYYGVKVESIFGTHFPKVPVTKSATEVTKLEEDKISAFYASGYLYAGNREEPALG